MFLESKVEEASAINQMLLNEVSSKDNELMKVI